MGYKFLNEYENVRSIPETAMSVDNFAKAENISVSWVYKKFKKGIAKYKIVTFQGYNFVIPN